MLARSKKVKSTPFSDFIREASSGEKKRVYSDVIRTAAAAQKELVDRVSDQK